MYSSVYLLMRLTPYLPSSNDDTAQTELYLFNELINPIHNQINCSVYLFDVMSNESIVYN